MTFTESFTILGLSQDASLEDVKKAYRKKAMRLHPDVNKSKNADAEFIALQKAYEKAQYYIENKDNLHSLLLSSFMKQAQANVKKQKQQTERRRQYAQSRNIQNEPPKKEKIQTAKFGAYTPLFEEKKYEWLIFKWIVSVVFSLTLIADAFAPIQTSFEKVIAIREKHYNDPVSLERKVQYILESENRTIPIHDSLIHDLKDALGIRIYKSVAFERIKYIVIEQHNRKKITLSYFDNVVFFPIIIFFLLLSFIGIGIKRKHEKISQYFLFYTQKVLPILLLGLPLIIAFT